MLKKMRSHAEQIAGLQNSATVAEGQIIGIEHGEPDSFLTNAD
jgi:hypothetical protein